MGGKSRANRIAHWAWLGAPLLWPAAGRAEPPATFAPAIRETQLMLYVSRPFGFRGASRSYGLRVDQASAPPLTAASIPLGPMHRSELVNLMVTPHVRMQVEFGRRLTWDLRGRRFSLTSPH